MLKNKLQNVKTLLDTHKQNHLLAFWPQLNETGKQNLLAEIERLNFSKIDAWVEKYITSPVSFTQLDNLTPPNSYKPQPENHEQRAKYAQARELGKKLISKGKVAVFVVAGGQGTRLGFDGPKGNFHISPVKNKTLFKLFAETIAANSKKYQTQCPWYIMTSPANHAQTEDIFQENAYYGLSKSDVFIFQQGTLPNFDFDGKILLADKSHIAFSPDGHGGSIKALHQSGAIKDMKNRGIEFISYWQIDNQLVNILDPLFVGLHALDQAEMSSKAVLKTEPKEKVGCFCLVDGKVTVIEYSDLPGELAEKRNPDGSLAFELGNIAIHLINVNFVEKLNAEAFSLPMHRAIKKIPCLDPQKGFIQPQKPNGIKLETFIFDSLPLASKSVILQTLRSEEFAPAKNAAGLDSAETARQMMVERAAGWLEYAGITVPRKADGSPDCIIEIASAFALDKDDIKAKADQISPIKPGDKIYLA